MAGDGQYPEDNSNLPNEEGLKIVKAFSIGIVNPLYPLPVRFLVLRNALQRFRSV